MGTYANTMNAYAEATGITDPVDAEIALQELLTGTPCTACRLPQAIADIDGTTCTCELPTYTERVLSGD